jgi:hypothetical protein
MTGNDNFGFEQFQIETKQNIHLLDFLFFFHLSIYNPGGKEVGAPTPPWVMWFFAQSPSL